MISLGLAVDPERARRADELVENAFNDFLADREREWQEVRVERPERVPPMAKPEDEPIGWTATDRKQAEERLEKYHQKVNAATKETTRRIVARGRALRRPGTNHDLGFDFYFNRDAIAEVFVKVGPAFFESPRAASWLARLSRAAKEPEPKTVEALRKYMDVCRVRSGALFFNLSNNGRNNRLTTKSIRDMVTSFLKESGIRNTTHGFRHFFTTKLIEHFSNDLLTVAKFTRRPADNNSPYSATVSATLA